MDLDAIRERLDPELVAWFAVEEDESYAPELHLVGLKPGELVRCFEILSRGARWNDRTFHVDAEAIDVTVDERPDVAELVAHGSASHACIGAEGIRVGDTELPLLEMFLVDDEIQFFWWPRPAWTTERVAALFALMARLLTVAPSARLRPDPIYSPAIRHRLGRGIARIVGENRLDYGGRDSPGA